MNPFIMIYKVGKSKSKLLELKCLLLHDCWLAAYCHDDGFVMAN